MYPFLKDRREKQNLTQAAIAEKAGIQLSQYQKFEYGERDLAQARIPTFKKIASAFGLTMDELMSEIRSASEIKEASHE